MSRFGKFLLGSAVVAAAAAGVYEFYKDNKAKKTATVNGEPEQEPEDLGENADDLDEEPGDLGDETAQEESPDKDTESEEKYDADDLADSAKKFAERTYTTIREGADAAGRAINENVVPKVREAIGPKGQDVLKTVGDAAGRMVDVAVDSTKKIVSIVKDETHYSTVDTKSAESSAEETGRTEESAAGEEAAAAEPSETAAAGADETAAKPAETCSDTAAAADEPAEPSGAGKTEDTEEEVKQMAADAVGEESEKVESFFDDGM